MARVRVGQRTTVDRNVNDIANWNFGTDWNCCWYEAGNCNSIISSTDIFDKRNDEPLSYILISFNLISLDKRKNLKVKLKK